MASIIKMNLNLDAIPKDKVFVGKKGKYLAITVTLNDEVDPYGNQGPVIVDQAKEEREAKVAKTYLGNAKVIWTNGTNVAAAPRDDQQGQQAPQAAAQEVDLPF